LDQRNRYHANMKIDIHKRLHHRSPYLLVDEVLDCDETIISTRKQISEKDYFMAGHFPGAPVVPGAMLQEMTTQSAGILIAEHYSPVKDYDSLKTKGHALGVLTRVHQAKFKGFARLGDELTIKVILAMRVDNTYRFKASVTSKGAVIMKNEFTLANLSDQVLTL